MNATYFTVTKQITDALMNDPRTKDIAIDVIYNQGMVILSGTVRSPEVAQAAEEIARAQPGVVIVTNELKVA